MAGPSLGMGGPSGYLKQMLVLSPKLARKVLPRYEALEKIKKRRSDNRPKR